MSLTRKLTTVAAVAGLLVPATVAAEDAPGATVALESVAVTGGAGEITATGVSTFGGESVVVGSDAAGDGSLPGTDLGDLSIGQDPDTGDLLFSMQLNDGLPVTGTTPFGLYYEWAQMFTGAGDIALHATWTQYNKPDADFNFSVAVTVDGNFTATVVDGEYTGTHLNWRVPVDVLGVRAGATLTGLAEVNVGGGGLFTIGGAAQDDVAAGKFAVGGSAKLVVRDAAGEVVDDDLARVRENGTFLATVEDLEPGVYTAEVHGLYADASVVQTFTVTVS